MLVFKSRCEEATFEFNTRRDTVISTTFNFINVDRESKFVTGNKVIDFNGQSQTVVGHNGRCDVGGFDSDAVCGVELEGVELCRSR